MNPLAMIHLCHSEAETAALGAALVSRLAPDGTLLLDGELGAGKTVLIRGLATALGLSADQVQSPTFTLIHEHGDDDVVLSHVDLYRLEPEEVPALGLDERFAAPGIVAIEWAERLDTPIPDAIRVTIRVRADGVREIEID
ncbi:MAG: tRNA (adenosine(37)-N6)-threonylcarbamoyltransferase complex ATPase subunit type 1 TsaE [Acidobacteriota bacterium]